MKVVAGMPRIRAPLAHVQLLARLMRAEAEGEGTLGMLMVGNVGVNRVTGDCSDFKRIRNLQQMVYQRPGGFEATIKGYFYQRARDRDIRLARRVINGERQHPASNALWFFKPWGRRPCPNQWYGQWGSGRYKAHCFYKPTARECPRVY
jgi:N-acetylmuramoyl-L-alanine amidase